MSMAFQVLAQADKEMLVVMDQLIAQVVAAVQVQLVVTAQAI
jgi:hypothetical protein